MLHWYILARTVFRDFTKPVDQRAEHPGFVEAGGPPPLTGCSATDRRRLFWLGVAETVPLVLAVWGGTVLSPDTPRWAWFALGTALMLAVSWCLRHHTPKTVIHIATLDRPSDEQDGARETPPHPARSV